MHEENYENEKSQDKYYHVSKKRTSKFIYTFLASFLGTLLALCLFKALHRPPFPPMPPMMPGGQYTYNQPGPCNCMKKFKDHHRMPGNEEFKERRYQHEDVKFLENNAPIPPAAKPDKK